MSTYTHQALTRTRTHTDFIGNVSISISPPALTKALPNVIKALKPAEPVEIAANRADVVALPEAAVADTPAAEALPPAVTADVAALIDAACAFIWYCLAPCVPVNFTSPSASNNGGFATRALRAACKIRLAGVWGRANERKHRGRVILKLHCFCIVDAGRGQD